MPSVSYSLLPYYFNALMYILFVFCICLICRAFSLYGISCLHILSTWQCSVKVISIISVCIIQGKNVYVHFEESEGKKEVLKKKCLLFKQNKDTLLHQTLNFLFLSMKFRPERTFNSFWKQDKYTSIKIFKYLNNFR